MKVFRIVLTVALFFAGPLNAQVSQGNGSQTGDGSTTFTGLAQAPEANLFAGTAGTSIPIQVPPGRKNLTPQLALGYNSNGGPSPYGYGWDLPLPPEPLNRVDLAGFVHDRDFLHLDWVRIAWSSETSALPPGPIGLAYSVVGTPLFALGGAFGFGN